MKYEHVMTFEIYDNSEHIVIIDEYQEQLIVACTGNAHTKKYTLTEDFIDCMLSCDNLHIDYIDADFGRTILEYIELNREDMDYIDNLNSIENKLKEALEDM